MTILLYLLITSFCLSASAQTTAYTPKEIYRSETLSIYQISEHIYEHVSYLQTKEFGKVACNGMIAVNQDEAIVFDTTTDDLSSLELINWIRKALHAKVKAVVPTHYHDDNLGGLNEFHKQGIPSYALQKTIEIALENNLPQPQNGFEQYVELTIREKEVYVEFLGEGHTCDNVIGYFPFENTLYGGCLVKEHGAGKGNLAEANVKEWPETMRKIKSKYPEVRLIIPGHGKSGGIELLDYTIQLFEK